MSYFKSVTLVGFGSTILFPIIALSQKMSYRNAYENRGEEDPSAPHFNNSELAQNTYLWSHNDNCSSAVPNIQTPISTSSPFPDTHRTNPGRDEERRDLSAQHCITTGPKGWKGSNSPVCFSDLLRLDLFPAVLHSRAFALTPLAHLLIQNHFQH